MREKMRNDLSGKVAIITGAGGVIGSAMAVAFARNGARVVLSDIALPAVEALCEEIRASGGECIAVKADVTDKVQTAALADTAIKQYGGIDVLINNAGVVPGADERKPFWEYSDDLWEKIISIDLSGAYYCSKPVAKYMVEHGGGCIINIASVTGIVPLRLQCAYVAAKAGLITLTKAMALELAEKGVRVNAICPGSVMTDQLREVFFSDKQRSDDLLSHIPQGRTGEPEEQAAMACFLASDDASYITGSTNIVDGGWICGFTRNL